MDLLIKGGRIVTGFGNPWYKSDIGIDTGKIVSIGNLTRERADTILNAEGKIVCPGFIDMHSHSDLMWLANPRCKAKVMQGVTTEVLAQDGISSFPVQKEHIPLLKSLVSGLLGDPDLEWDWSGVGDYLEKFEKNGVSINIATLVPHGNLRICVMGMDKRDPSPHEIDQMRELLIKSMNEGGVGLSTGLIYAPCHYAKKDELVDLCKVVKKYHGYMAVHIRNEADRAYESILEVIQIGRESGSPIHINHFKASGKVNWGKAANLLRLVEEGREKGVDLTIEQYPYTAGSTSLWALLPPWSLEGGLEKTFERLKNSKIRKKIKQDIRTTTSEWENIIKDSGWNNIFISSLTSKKNEYCIGKNLHELSERLGEDPEDILFNLLLEERGAVTVVLFVMSEDDVHTIMTHPIQMFCTDGLLPPGKPHPRAYGTYPKVLGKYVREEHILSLEDAIRRMTSYPAQRLRLNDRGIIRIGAWADLVIFDPEKIIDKATYMEPQQYPEGIEYVLINGAVVVKQKRHTGILAGKVLKPLLQT